MNTSAIRILDNGATQSLAGLRDKLAPGRRQPLMRVLGKKAEALYRAHFMLREATSPNKQGWPRQHFWARLRLATAFDASRTTDNSATVVIAERAINAKLHGGTWGARESKYLAIPLRAEVYGTRPKSNFIDGLFFLRARAGKEGGYLAKREGKQLTFFWRLAPRVTLAPDPNTLPPAAGIISEILKTAASFTRRNTPQPAP